MSGFGASRPRMLKKWQEQEDLKPPKERRKMPEPPREMAELPIGGAKMSTAQLDAYNLKAFNTFETESLNTCPYCNRTFNDVAWSKHQKMCTAAKPFRPAGTGLGKESLSTKLEPGLIGGTQHARMVLPEAGERLRDRVGPAAATYEIEASAVTGASRKVLAAAADPAAGAPPLLGRTAKPKPAAAAPVASVGALGATGNPAALSKAAGPAAAPRASAAAQGPPLPADVTALVKEVFEAPVGAAGVSAVAKYLQLDWLTNALAPAGIPPLLANKFLTLAKQKA
eukprot:jgi/Astpho2/3835/Aster-x0595